MPREGCRKCDLGNDASADWHSPSLREAVGSVLRVSASYVCFCHKQECELDPSQGKSENCNLWKQMLD